MPRFHCHFDKEDTSLFFDMIDRRYAKETDSTIIFTSNSWQTGQKISQIMTH